MGREVGCKMQKTEEEVGEGTVQEDMEDRER